jgi:hypothetical protein
MEGMILIEELCQRDKVQYRPAVLELVSTPPINQSLGRDPVPGLSLLFEALNDLLLCEFDDVI